MKVYQDFWLWLLRVGEENILLTNSFFYRDADDACHDLNGKEFMGERVSVEIAKGTPHGRDRDRWGTGPGGSGRRSRRFGHKLIFLGFFGKKTFRSFLQHTFLH